MPALLVALQTYQPSSSWETLKISRLPLLKKENLFPVRAFPSLNHVMFVFEDEEEHVRLAILYSSTDVLLGVSRNLGWTEDKTFCFNVSIFIYLVPIFVFLWSCLFR